MNDSRYRLVVQRSPKKEDGEVVTDMFGTVYVYRAIITNDWKMSDKDLVLFYNKRGESEKNFDIQNNDFGWAHLPLTIVFVHHDSAMSKQASHCARCSFRSPS